MRIAHPPGMWTYRLIIRSRNHGETRIFGEESALEALKEELAARMADGSDVTVTYRPSGEPVVIRVDDVAALSDIDPVIVPDDLALSLG